MLGLQYTGLALKHWKEWRPKAYRQMQEDGTLNEAAQAASKEAARQVAELMEAGYQKHEAEEVVLRETIFCRRKRTPRGTSGRRTRAVRAVRKR